MIKTNSIRLTNKIILTAVSLLILLPNFVNAQCDALFVEALKRRGYINEKEDIGISTRKARCSSRSNSLGFSYVDDSTKYKGSQKSTSQACHESDDTYFKTYHKEVLYSFLPPDAIEVLSACFGLLSFTASDNGGNITFKAGYRPTGRNTVAKLESFTWTPVDALDCDGTEFKPGDILIPGGKSITCKRKGNAALNVNFNTSEGSKEVAFLPRVKYDKLNWSIVTSGKRFKCVDQFNNGDQQWILFRGHTNPSQAVGSCLVRYGFGRIYFGQGAGAEPLKDKWGYDLYGNGPKFQCTLNGAKTGVPENCKDSGVCGSVIAIQSFCASKYNPN